MRMHPRALSNPELLRLARIKPRMASRTGPGCSSMRRPCRLMYSSGLLHTRHSIASISCLMSVRSESLALARMRRAASTVLPIGASSGASEKSPSRLRPSHVMPTKGSASCSNRQLTTCCPRGVSIMRSAWEYASRCSMPASLGLSGAGRRSLKLLLMRPPGCKRLHSERKKMPARAGIEDHRFGFRCQSSLCTG